MICKGLPKCGQLGECYSASSWFYSNYICFIFDIPIKNSFKNYPFDSESITNPSKTDYKELNHFNIPYIRLYIYINTLPVKMYKP